MHSNNIIGVITRLKVQSPARGSDVYETLQYYSIVYSKQHIDKFAVLWARAPCSTGEDLFCNKHDFILEFSRNTESRNAPVGMNSAQ